MRIAPIAFNTQQPKITFNANNKIDYETTKRDLDQISNDFNVVYDKYKKTDFKSHDVNAVETQSQVTKEIENISERFKILDRFLSDGDNIKSNALEIIEQFTNAQRRLDKHSGFNKIIGHDEIKEQLKEEFSINKILKSQVMDDIKVPNSLLFFGPTGCGKTYFATALAEQSITKYVTIDSKSKSEDEIFAEILNAAQKSKEHFDKTGQRSIIVYNEADAVLYEGSPIEKAFLEFIKDCSDKYKCTMFLTSNYPLDISPEILSDAVTPLKIAVPNPDNKMIYTYLKNKIHTINKSVNIENIAATIALEPKRFSFSELNDIIDEALKLDPTLKEKTLVTVVKSKIKAMNGISKHSLETFENAVKTLCK